MPQRSTSSHRSAQEESRALSAAVSVSVVAHAVALGTLLMLKPVLHSAPPLAVIEISLVPDQAPGRLHANNPSGAPPGETAAEVSVAPFLSLTRPAVTRKASSPDWSRSVDTARSFDMPSLPTFRPHTHALVFDTLATMLDCLAIGGSTHAAGRSRHLHPPCGSDDPPVRAPVSTFSQTSTSQPNEIGTDSDYRTFRPLQPVFYESVLPTEVAPANRAFENWIAGMFR